MTTPPNEPMSELSPEELFDKQELRTYLDGLRDALNMTKPQLRKAIKILEE